MADETLVGKTILQLDPLTGLIDRANSYIEVHVTGRGASQKVALDSVVLRGLSAKEVVQLTHPEIVTDAQFIAFITGPTGVKGTDGKDGAKGTDGKDGKDGKDGAKGTDGTIGVDGKSAYQIAQANGFVGTEAQWLASLLGAPGAKGEPGKDAFQVAVDGGYEGTVEEWIASIKGPTGEKGIDGVKGKSAYEVAVEEGFVGTVAEWLLSLKGKDGLTGPNGKSAYQVAVQDGFVGTEVEWLASLKGKDGNDGVKGNPGNDGAKGADGKDGKDGNTGANGKSAYQVALDGGFVGTEAQWLLSLVGAKGAKGENAHVGTLAGVLDHVEDLPPVADYAENDYFIVGTHIYMKANGDWNDLGSFEGPPGKDGSGITVLGELPGIGYLPNAAERNGDAWLIGKNMYVWNGARWQLQGQEGLQGKPGVQGPAGKSALDLAQETNPAIQTQNDLWVYLRGFPGEQGDKGEAAITFITDGHVAAPANLPAVGVEGHGWLVGTVPGAYEYWVWLDGSFFNMGNNVGPAGPQGSAGQVGPRGPAGRAIHALGQLPSVDQLPTTGNLEGDMYTVLGGADNNSVFMAVWTVNERPFADYWRLSGNIRGPQGRDGARGPVGQPVNAKGEKATVGDLPAVGNVIGDAYEVAGYIYVYGADGFERMGQWRGTNGTNGTNGKSAYQAAVDKGFQGTESQWVTSLKGKDGVSFQYIGHFAALGDIPAGAHVNESATVGDPAHLYLSYNGVWKDVGLAGQKGDQGLIGPTGPNGKSAYEIAVERGFQGTEGQWIAYLKGLAGKTAFELAQEEGFQGTVEEWVASLSGTDGLNGKSAYQIALEEGFVGTQDEWLASLVGKSLQFIGDFASPAEFPVGVISNVATAAGHVYIHNGTTWVDVGPIASGPKGDKGETGGEGKSAYELAVQNGFQGDLTAWLASLKGAQGAVGKSIYQDAVDRGLFQGTFEEFLVLQKGDTGASAYEEALENGTIPPGTSFADFIASLKGAKGADGGVGPTGPVGPAVRILGQLATTADLPVNGVVGTGYVIPDQTTPGTFNTHIWIAATTSWLNLGHTVGEKGTTGDRGLPGIKGADGAKGDVGSIWIVLAREPQAIDGRIDDYFLNSASQEYFRKTGAAVWASLGFMGGGNLYKPNSDGKIKGIKDGAWVDLALLNSIPADATEVYQVVNGQWKKFDTYTLKAVVATNTVDFSAARVFRIDNTAAATVALTNVPDADHATTVVVKVYGKVGAFQWTLPAGKGTLRWFDGAAPAFTNDVTTIVFTWDGREMTGSVPN